MHPYESVSGWALAILAGIMSRYDIRPARSFDVGEKFLGRQGFAEKIALDLIAFQFREDL